MIQKLALVGLLTCTSGPAMAAYTANHAGIVGWLAIYNSDVIYFSLANMPTNHGCSSNYFIIDPSITEKQRDRYYAMLLAAYTNGKPVSVGYDGTSPDCIANRPKVHALKFE